MNIVITGRGYVEEIDFGKKVIRRDNGSRELLEESVKYPRNYFANLLPDYAHTFLDHLDRNESGFIYFIEIDRDSNLKDYVSLEYPHITWKEGVEKLSKMVEVNVPSPFLNYVEEFQYYPIADYCP